MVGHVDLCFNMARRVGRVVRGGKNCLQVELALVAGVNCGKFVQRSGLHSTDKNVHLTLKQKENDGQECPSYVETKRRRRTRMSILQNDGPRRVDGFARIAPVLQTVDAATVTDAEIRNE